MILFDVVRRLLCMGGLLNAIIEMLVFEGNGFNNEIIRSGYGVICCSLNLFSLQRTCSNMLPL